MPIIEKLKAIRDADAPASVITVADIIKTKDRSVQNLQTLHAVSLEVASFTGLENNPNLKGLVVDSFDNADNIDPSSSNYELTEAGAVRLIQGGARQASDKTTSDFNGGTFTQTETFDDGADGAVRKEVVSAGGVVELESYDTLANVATTGDATQSLTTNPIFIKSGTGALQLTVDFTGITTAQSITTTTLPTPVDVSNDSTLTLNYYQPVEKPVLLTFEVEDNVGQTHTFPQQALPGNSQYQPLAYLIADIASGNPALDLTNLNITRITLDEDVTAQVIIDVPEVGTTETKRVRQNSALAQTFMPSADAIAQRVTFQVLRSASTDQPLRVALADSFGTTLARTQIDVGDATTAFQSIEFTLDEQVQLKADITYQIRIESDFVGTGNNGWGVLTSKNGSVYADGFLKVNGSDSGDDLFFTISTIPPTGSIYFDEFTVTGASTYQATGEFLSRTFNLGGTPSTLDQLAWTEVAAGTDTIQVRVRFAATEPGLAAAAWSGFLANPETAFLGITADQWFQYEIQWTGGDTSSSSFVRDVTLDYTLPGGTGTAEVISAVENMGSSPTEFMMNFEVVEGSGTALFYVSRDGKTTWLPVVDASNGELLDFTGPAGTQFHMRALLTGNAELFGWSGSTDEVFI